MEKYNLFSLNFAQNLMELQSNLSNVTFQWNIEIGSHKTGGC